MLFNHILFVLICKIPVEIDTLKADNNQVNF